MKKLVDLVIITGCIFLLFGCVRSSKYKVERSDQELSGNRGYYMGNLPPPPERPEKLDREVVNIDIDLPPYDSWDRYRWIDKKLWGNRGYMIGGSEKIEGGAEEELILEVPSNEKETGVEPEVSPVVEKPAQERAESGSVISEVKENLPTTYKVKKGDTLWKIAGYKEIYGSPAKWTILYEANKDQINDPDSLKPGITLNIPRN
ncbi:MAG: LysM peptidoglycan-binding domain-containing protein [Candidatus Omnitrophica bacterium]|nr:LysM peptidoglycan-binding domain-containing protein [Candidatus Omnitrophota bacterium]